METFSFKFDIFGREFSDKKIVKKFSTLDSLGAPDDSTNECTAADIN